PIGLAPPHANGEHGLALSVLECPAPNPCDRGRAIRLRRCASPTLATLLRASRRFRCAPCSGHVARYGLPPCRTARGAGDGASRASISRRAPPCSLRAPSRAAAFGRPLFPRRPVAG